MKAPKHLISTVDVILQPLGNGSWAVVWPNCAQEFVLTIVTHDEIMRFPGLQEYFREHPNTMDARLTITVGKEEAVAPKAQKVSRK